MSAHSQTRLFIAVAQCLLRSETDVSLLPQAAHQRLLPLDPRIRAAARRTSFAVICSLRSVARRTHNLCNWRARSFPESLESQGRYERINEISELLTFGRRATPVARQARQAFRERTERLSRGSSSVKRLCDNIQLAEGAGLTPPQESTYSCGGSKTKENDHGTAEGWH